MNGSLSKLSDRYFQEVRSIDWPRFAVQSGNAFMHSYFATVTATNITTLIRTGSRELHITPYALSACECLTRIYEGSVFDTTTSYGTAVTPTNMNRTINTASSATLYNSPTITGAAATLGSLLFTGYLRAGVGPNVSGGEFGLGREGSEIILKANTNYLFRVQNAAGSASALYLGLTWYEE